MPSSTSSSRPLALRATIAGLGILLVALGIIRGFTEVAEAQIPEVFGVTRIKTAYQALPRIAAAPGPKALFLGSSTVEFGFAPQAFDAHLERSGIEITSYNLGIGNMNPSLQVVLARRIRAEFESSGHRVDLMLIELNPFQTTERRVRANEPLHEAVLSIFSTPRSLWRDFVDDPERGARLFTIKYLREGVAAQAITEGLGMAVEALGDLLAEEKEARTEEEARILEERGDLAFELFGNLREEHPDQWPFGTWSFETRGGNLRLTDLAPQTRALVPRLMANLQYPPSLQNDLENRIRCCDIVDLHFDEGLVHDFIAMVRELAAISDRIEVVLMPKNNDWVKNPPEARARQRPVLERIERETGVRVVDYQHLQELDGGYFWDVSHMTPEGGEYFSARLAEDWSERLYAEKNASVRASMLSRVGAPSGEVGSTGRSSIRAR